METIEAMEVGTVQRTHNPVVHREQIAKCEEIVEHTVPKGARAHAGLPDQIPPYLSWPVHVPGGKVWLYLHGDDPEKLIGRTVRVKVVLMRRRREDGTEDDYLDLTVAKAPATHRLFVIANDNEARYDAILKEWFYKKAVHVGALIVVAPLNIKYLQNGGFYQAPPKQPKEPARPSTGYTTVDRMVNEEGWHIESEDDTKFVLTKMKNGKEVTKEVPKPKKKPASIKRR